MSRDNNSFDIIFIGAGPGGYVGAIRAAQLGQRVALIERRETLGGTCLNVGCIPSKVLLDSSELYYKNVHEAASHGILFKGLSFDVASAMKRKRRVVNTLTSGLAGVIKRNGISVYTGSAVIKGRGVVQVKGGVLTAPRIVVASGSVPQELPSIPFNGETIVSSTDALEFSEVPARVLVVGAGAIGLELGSVWQRLGSAVTVCEMQASILPTGDSQVSGTLQRLLESEGMTFRLSTAVQGTKKRATGIEVTLQKGDGALQTLETDVILVAVGRRPNTEGLGLDDLGVASWRTPQGQIKVNERFETPIEGIYAIGDVIHGPMLAHKAEEDGVIAVEQMITGVGRVNYNTVPNVVYTWPEVASVGESEAALKKRGQRYTVGRFPFGANGRALAMNADFGFVKILACKESDRILGAHIIGPWASALIAEVVTVMEFEGCSEDIARIVHAHPTLTEATREAALNVMRRALHLSNQ